MILNFKLQNQIIKRTDKKIVINKSKNILFADFIFEGEEWEGIHKFAIFKNEKMQAFTSSLGLDDNCRCSVPAEAITGRYLKVSVYGGDLVTSNELTITLVPAGYTTNISNSSMSNGKDIFVDVYEKIESKIDNIIYEEGYLKCRSGEEVLCQVPLFLDVEEMIKLEVKENLPYFKLSNEGDLSVVYPD